MQIVIVGGGFAGIRSALELSKRNLGRITLISDYPYFLNRNTLYGAAVGGHESASVLSLEDIFAKHHDIRVVTDRLTAIDPERRLARTKHKNYPYDNLILALGSTVDYANVPGANNHTFDVRTLEHVRQLRRRIEQTLASDQASETIYTVVGGGVSGVELAAALASFAARIQQTYTPNHAKIHIGIMEQSPRLLPRYSRTASKIVTRRLRELGVSIFTNYQVTKVNGRTITASGHKLPSETTIWATGVQNNSFYQDHPSFFQLDHNGNVLVNPYLEAYKHIFVLGDNTNLHKDNSAHNAIDSGSFIAEHLARVVTDRPLKPFRPKKHSLSIPLGEGWAYIEHHGVYAKGRLGYALRRRQTLRNYRQIVSKNQALKAWNEANNEDISKML